MKKHQHTPARCKFSIFRQLCNHIPCHLVPQLARQTGVAQQARSFSAWSHVVALMYAQFTHAVGLNDVCDSLRLRSGPLSTVRAATAPARNTLSHANQKRPAKMAEQLFWKTLDQLRQQSPAFGRTDRRRRIARFKLPIHVVDSTTVQLIASALDWARHRYRKAAAKCHLRLDLHSFLPRFVLIDTAREHDIHRAGEMCAELRAGEIVLFDKAYADFSLLGHLNKREVWWVTRARTNLQVKVLRRRLVPVQSKILRDDEVVLVGFRSRQKYPQVFRRVVALVERDGVERPMTFLTNNLKWAASTVAELYRCRWHIEVFFKQIKQTLQLADFLGNSANAVRWQVWTALLLYVLMRFMCVISSWSHSFTRLFTLLRAALWRRIDLWNLLRFCGTAGGHFRYLATPQSAYLPGFAQ